MEDRWFSPLSLFPIFSFRRCCFVTAYSGHRRVEHSAVSGCVWPTLPSFSSVCLDTKREKSKKKEPCLE